MNRSRRPLLRLGALLTAVAVAAACTPGGASGGKSEGGKKSVTFAYSNAVMQVEKVPIHLALEKLKKQGTTTKESFFQSGDDAVPAVARGEADFGTANASTVFAATKKGVPIRGIMTSVLPAYLLVAPTSVKNPGQLDGKRVGIQAKVSSTTLYTHLALEKYPKAKPKVLVVPGSANRVQAMMAGQLDASVVQISDWLTLQKKAPGKFHVVYDVATENPDIIDSVIFTSTKTLKSDPEYVRSFVKTLTTQYASMYGDQKKLANDIGTLVPNTSKEAATQIAEDVTKDKIWPPDGGFTQAQIDATLSALKSAKMLDAASLPTAKQCCTREFVG